MNQSNSHLFLLMPSRLVRCVLFSLLTLLSAPLWAATAEPAARALHLLGYLGADYPATPAYKNTSGRS